MWTEEALPDWDLESVYGQEALRTRLRASAEHHEQKYAETIRTLHALYQRLAQREEPLQNSS